MGNFYYIRIISIAIKSLLDDFGRTFLSLLGIIISVIAIMVVITLGALVDRYIQDTIGAFGTDTIQIEIAVPSESLEISTGSIAGTALIDTLVPEDAFALERIPSITAATIGVIGQSRVVYDGDSKQTLLLGADQNALLVDQGADLDHGRFFTEEEAHGKAHVLVIGFKLAQDLFDSVDPVGERVRVGSTTYRVIGVLKERGSLFGFDFDSLAYLPYSALTKEILGQDHISYITAKVRDTTQVESAAEDIRALMRLRHESNGPGEDDFRVTSTQEAQDLLGSIVDVIALLLVALASVSVIVGGVGIMNMMLMSVEERKREIGLRKAIGANRDDILAQFLVESLVISLFAAVIGVALGALILWGVATLALSQGLEFTFFIPLNAVFLSAGFSAAAGIIFGVYPARQAAKIDPVEAMR